MNVIRYARERTQGGDRAPRGVVIARVCHTPNGVMVRTGYSICAVSKGDSFRKKFGRDIAERRLESRGDLCFMLDDDNQLSAVRSQIPDISSMRQAFDNAVHRCRVLADRGISLSC